LSLKRFAFPLISMTFSGLLVISASNPVVGESTSERQWLSGHHLDHHLVGKIWSSRDKAFVSYKQLLSSLKSARYVLLGETHPNKDHHLLQAQFLDAMAKMSQSPSFGAKPPVAPRLVVEMIPQSYGPILNNFRQANPSETLELGKTLKWQKRGWGAWENYKPIFDVAYRHKLAIFPGNLDRDDVRKIGRKGIKALDEQQQRQLSLDVAYTKSQSELLADMLFDSHCKMVPKTALSPMQLVQQARDGIMASGMLGTPIKETANKTAAVLIAGSGHIRRDWAVPRILRAREPDIKIVTISFTEVTPEHKKPQDYEPASADRHPVYDYLYFTPKSEIKDYCAELIKRFKKHKTK